MSATTHAPVRLWARSHRAAVAISILAMALAATLALLILRVGSGPTATSTSGHSSTGQHSAGDPTGPSYVPPLQRINEGCSIARFGVPC